MLALARGAPDAYLQASLGQEGVESAHQLSAALLESCEFWPIPPATRTNDHIYANTRSVQDSQVLQHTRRNTLPPENGVVARKRPPGQALVQCLLLIFFQAEEAAVVLIHDLG